MYKRCATEIRPSRTGSVGTLIARRIGAVGRCSCGAMAITRNCTIGPHLSSAHQAHRSESAPLQAL